MDQVDFLGQRGRCLSWLLIVTLAFLRGVEQIRMDLNDELPLVNIVEADLEARIKRALRLAKIVKAFYEGKRLTTGRMEQQRFQVRMTHEF